MEIDIREPQTQPRDQITMPAAREKRRSMGYGCSRKRVSFALKADVKKAHRLFRVRKEDWGWLAMTLMSL